MTKISSQSKNVIHVNAKQFHWFLYISSVAYVTQVFAKLKAWYLIGKIRQDILKYFVNIHFGKHFGLKFGPHYCTFRSIIKKRILSLFLMANKPKITNQSFTLTMQWVTVISLYKKWTVSCPSYVILVKNCEFKWIVFQKRHALMIIQFMNLLI